MAQRALTREQCKQAIDAVNAALRDGYRLDSNPSAVKEAAKRLKVNAGTFQHRFAAAQERYGIKPDMKLQKRLEKATEGDTVVHRLEEENKALRAEIRDLKREELSRETIRQQVFKLAAINPNPPAWTTKPSKRGNTTGTPTILLSDFHWGEVVKPDEIGGVNEFNLEIAHKRLKRLVEVSLSLLFDHMSKPSYDGLVLPLGGDMITGDIHEELTVTNDIPVLPTIMDLYGKMVWVIDEYLKHFQKVFIPCVTGNHGRKTKKIQCKERWATSFDWMLYAMLERYYAKDSRVTVLASHSPDVLYRIYSHAYLLTHGDQFRGGDGLIGSLGPLTRGRHKKASRDASMSQPWDTMICGHFHTLMQLPHLIVNGSLKGYDEFAHQNNFSYELPSQAMWITNPDYGITIQMPVYLDDEIEKKGSGWVAIQEAA